jgi:hypothetical protein
MEITHDTVINIFERLQPGKMYWRANWLLTLDVGLSPYEAGICGTKPNVEEADHPKRTENMDPEVLAQTGLPLLSGVRGLDNIMLRVEYQTIRF